VLRRQDQAGTLAWSAVVGLLEPPCFEESRRLPAWRDLSGLAGWVARLEKGNRNCGLFWAACRIAEAGQDGLFGELAAAAALTGLPDREIAGTIASARRTVTQQGHAA
jgi:hypothetical protein